MRPLVKGGLSPPRVGFGQGKASRWTFVSLIVLGGSIRGSLLFSPLPSTMQLISQASHPHYPWWPVGWPWGITRIVKSKKEKSVGHCVSCSRHYSVHLGYRRSHSLSWLSIFLKLNETHTFTFLANGNKTLIQLQFRNRISQNLIICRRIEHFTVVEFY